MNPRKSQLSSLTRRVYVRTQQGCRQVVVHMYRTRTDRTRTLTFERCFQGQRRARHRLRSTRQAGAHGSAARRCGLHEVCGAGAAACVRATSLAGGRSPACPPPPTCPRRALARARFCLCRRWTSRRLCCPSQSGPRCSPGRRGRRWPSCSRPSTTRSGAGWKTQTLPSSARCAGGAGAGEGEGKSSRRVAGWSRWLAGCAMTLGMCPTRATEP